MIPESYAKAVYELTKQQGTQDRVLNELKIIAEIFEKNIHFKCFFDSPVISVLEKEKILDTIFRDRINLTLLNFFKLLSKKRILHEIDTCFEKFCDLYNKDLGIEYAEVFAASEINMEIQQKLLHKLERITGKKIILDIKIDKSLIGGIAVKYKDKVFDGSIKQKLAAVSEKLKGVS